MADPKDMANRIAGSFDTAFDQLQLIEQANRAKLPEEVFKGIFLPLFANLENQHPHATINNWIGIAGSPFNPVDVIAEGQVLFTVPPMFSKDAVNPQAMSRSEPLAHIVSIAEKLSLRSPIEGQNYIDNKYAGVSRNVRGNVNRVAYAQEWNTIFDRYGLPKLVELGEAAPVAVSANADIKAELQSDDIDFTPI